MILFKPITNISFDSGLKVSVSNENGEELFSGNMSPPEDLPKVPEQLTDDIPCLAWKFIEPYEYDEIIDNQEKILKQNEYDKKIYFEVLERVKFDSEKANADIEDTIKRLEVRFRKLIEDLEKEYSIFDHECGMRRKFPQKLWCCLNR